MQMCPFLKAFLMLLTQKTGGVGVCWSPLKLNRVSVAFWGFGSGIIERVKKTNWENVKLSSIL